MFVSGRGREARRVAATGLPSGAVRVAPPDERRAPSERGASFVSGHGREAGAQPSVVSKTGPVVRERFSSKKPG